MKTYRVPDVALEYEFLEGRGPVVVFCPGFASDMGGTKAMRLWAQAEKLGQAMLRFDYSGHGASGGAFSDGCIGDWTADAAHVIATVVPGREVLLVGSSMGGWIALLLARALGARVAGLLLIAPAPDFTELLMKPALTPAEQEALARDGLILPPSQYGEPTPITAKLLADGADHLLLNAPIPIACPVHILHGMKDPDVPWELSLRLTERLETPDVRLTYVKDGDHRLSREADLRLLEKSVEALLCVNKK
ncbi:MAG TPA: alpha/beta hydrolase [Acidocella sp.]|nr:alpha/beta hydrolase [Acidocella sp.]